MESEGVRGTTGNDRGTTGNDREQQGVRGNDRGRGRTTGEQ